MSQQQKPTVGTVDHTREEKESASSSAAVAPNTSRRQVSTLATAKAPPSKPKPPIQTYVIIGLLVVCLGLAIAVAFLAVKYSEASSSAIATTATAPETDNEDNQTGGDDNEPSSGGGGGGDTGGDGGSKPPSMPADPEHSFGRKDLDKETMEFLSARRNYTWRDKTCANHGKCAKSDYSSAPLLLVSFDGFRHEYLKKKVVKSLDFVAECGVRAERVFPSVPTKTFPNHFSIVTGLYPENHGVADNWVYFPDKDASLGAMNVMDETFYEAEAIWSVLTRTKKKPSHTFFWPGSEARYDKSKGIPQSNYHQPDQYMKYGGDKMGEKIIFRDQILQVMEWLTMEESKRPGLVTMYIRQPDASGHEHYNEESMEWVLDEVDRIIDTLFTLMKEAGIFECVNVAIVSDHGMQRLNASIDVKALVNNNKNFNGKVEFSTGNIAKLYFKKGYENDANLKEGVTNLFSCNKGDEYIMYTKETMPPRWHSSVSKKVGDIILSANAGGIFGTFYAFQTKYWGAGNHGYDNILESMHTIFFARGPAFKPKAVVPAFQNIEYFCLFTDVLGIDRTETENRNCTYGLLHELLAKPPQMVRHDGPTNPLKQCPAGAADFSACDANICKTDAVKTFSAEQKTCAKDWEKIVVPVSSKDHCRRSFCKTVFLESNDAKVAFPAIIRYVKKGDSEVEGVPECEVHNNANGQCAKNANLKSAFSFWSKDAAYSPALVNTDVDVIKTVLDPLASLTKEYINKFGQAIVISGVASDEDLNGFKDDQVKKASHVYRIILMCNNSAWSDDFSQCKKPEDTFSMSFIVPLMKKDANCLKPHTFFREYMARIADVEMISGLEFDLPNAKSLENDWFRLRITTQLGLH